MNNHHKILSLYGAPLRKYESFFSKKSFSWWEGGRWGKGDFFGLKTYKEVILNRRTNDQIISRWGRSFINGKFIFQ